MLTPINPYITVTQKTVFLAKDKLTGKLFSRDGYGFSRLEKPPMKLHQLNNFSSFVDFKLEKKIQTIFNKNFQKEENEIKKITENLSSEDIETIKSAFESYIRKKIIYYKIAEFELLV